MNGAVSCLPVEAQLYAKAMDLGMQNKSQRESRDDFEKFYFGLAIRYSLDKADSYDGKNNEILAQVTGFKESYIPKKIRSLELNKKGNISLSSDEIINEPENFTLKSEDLPVNIVSGENTEKNNDIERLMTKQKKEKIKSKRKISDGSIIDKKILRFIVPKKERLNI